MKDTFRKNYHILKSESAIQIAALKDKAEELLVLMSSVKSREMSLAETHLETSIMWATKSIVLKDELEQVAEQQAEKPEDLK